MKRSTKDRIRTTHTGSLPRPPEMLDTMRAMAAGQPYDAGAYESALAKHVAETVRKQVAAGIDIVTDGECSKPSFRLYLAERLDGFESRMPPGGLPVPTGPMGIGGRDAAMFPDFYRTGRGLCSVRNYGPSAAAQRTKPRPVDRAGLADTGPLAIDRITEGTGAASPYRQFCFRSVRQRTEVRDRSSPTFTPRTQAGGHRRRFFALSRKMGVGSDLYLLWPGLRDHAGTPSSLAV